MKKVKILTPENIEVEYTLADVTSRTAAAFIDIFIQTLLMTIILVIVGLTAGFAKSIWNKYYGWIIGITLIAIAFINLAYFIIMELTMNGQTPGKKVLRLRTIRKNGQPVTLKHSAIRNLLRVFVDDFGVGVVVMFFSKQHKRIGDIVASTIVVSEGSKTRPITLESLQNFNEKLKYCVSEEEYEILREYIERRDNMENNQMLRNELKRHFTQKFEALGIINEWEGFINEL